VQEENEIPSSVFVNEPAPLPEVEEDTPATDANRSQEEGLQTIALSSDEEQGPEEDEDDILRVLDLEAETRVEKSRAEKIKRSSLKKVDSLKKAFSRQNIEKKMNKIVSQEKRDKIKKSLTPNHQKSPSAKNTSFKVSPLTFNIKKNRNGEGQPETEDSAQPESSPRTRLTPSSSSKIIFQVNYIRCLFYVFVQVWLIFGGCRYLVDSSISLG